MSYKMGRNISDALRNKHGKGNNHSIADWTTNLITMPHDSKFVYLYLLDLNGSKGTRFDRIYCTRFFLMQLPDPYLKNKK